MLRDFNKVDYSKNLAELQKQTTLLQVKQTDLLSKKEKQVEKQNKLNTKIINLTKKLKVVDDNIQDIDGLEDNLLIQGDEFKKVLKDIDKTNSEFNDLFNLVWRSKTRINEKGWFAEVKIPFVPIAIFRERVVLRPLFPETFVKLKAVEVL